MSCDGNDLHRHQSSAAIVWQRLCGRDVWQQLVSGDVGQQCGKRVAAILLAMEERPHSCSLRSATSGARPALTVARRSRLKDLTHKYEIATEARRHTSATHVIVDSDLHVSVCAVSNLPSQQPSRWMLGPNAERAQCVVRTRVNTNSP